MLKERTYEGEKDRKQLSEYYTSQIRNRYFLANKIDELSSEINDKDKYIRKLDGIIDYVKTIFKVDKLEDLGKAYYNIVIEKYIYSYQNLTNELDMANK